MSKYSDRGQIIAVFDDADSVIEMFTYGVEGRFMTTVGNNESMTTYLITDQLGSMRVAMAGDPDDSTTEVRQYINNHPFGILAQSGGNYQADFRYTGHEYDAHGTFKFHYMGARYYDDRTGQFTGIDKAGEFASGYNYVGNDPIMRWDPDGNDSDGTQHHYYGPSGTDVGVKTTWPFDPISLVNPSDILGQLSLPNTDIPYLVAPGIEVPTLPGMSTSVVTEDTTEEPDPMPIDVSAAYYTSMNNDPTMDPNWVGARSRSANTSMPANYPFQMGGGAIKSTTQNYTSPLDQGIATLMVISRNMSYAAKPSEQQVGRPRHKLDWQSEGVYGQPPTSIGSGNGLEYIETITLIGTPNVDYLMLSLARMMTVRGKGEGLGGALSWLTQIGSNANVALAMKLDDRARYRGSYAHVSYTTAGGGKAYWAVEKLGHGIVGKNVAIERAGDVVHQQQFGF